MADGRTPKVGPDVDRAIGYLMRGELVGIPTETVYGLGANALMEKAIRKVFLVKGRPLSSPLIVHIGSTSSLGELVGGVPAFLNSIIDAFWPGPLTLVLKKSTKVSDLVTSNLGTVAVRMPDHPLTLSLLSKAGFPLVAPSANPFGYVSPTSAQHVSESLGAAVPYVLDGGPCRVGLESTIAEFKEPDRLVIHREGTLGLKELSRYAHVEFSKSGAGGVRMPGSHPRHYAPRKRLLVGDIEELMERMATDNVGILSFRRDFEIGKVGFVLSPGGNLSEAARRLYQGLRYLDSKPVEAILSEWLPGNGIGSVINDRLKRASQQGGCTRDPNPPRE